MERDEFEAQADDKENISKQLKKLSNEQDNLTSQNKEYAATIGELEQKISTMQQEN